MNNGVIFIHDVISNYDIMSIHVLITGCMTLMSYLCSVLVSPKRQSGPNTLYPGTASNLAIVLGPLASSKVYLKV